MNDDTRTNQHLLEELQRAHNRINELEACLKGREQEERHAQEALKKRENILRETYHHSNNAMATICNLLYLQASRASDEPTRNLLKSVENKVRTMALILEKYYRASDIEKLDFNDLVREISFHVFRSYQVGGSQVILRLDLSDSQLAPSRVVIPSGLILNELISNAMKFAFVDGRRGEITVSLHRAPGDMVELGVADNGVGMPDAVDSAQPETLGLHLVQLLGERQLGGSVTLVKNQGLQWLIRFQVSEDKE